MLHAALSNPVGNTTSSHPLLSNAAGELPAAESPLAAAAGLSPVLQNHPPSAVSTLLCCRSCNCSFAVGRALAKRNLMAASTPKAGKDHSPTNSCLPTEPIINQC